MQSCICLGVHISVLWKWFWRSPEAYSYLRISLYQCAGRLWPAGQIWFLVFFLLFFFPNLFLYIKFYWPIAMPTHLCNVYGCFQAILGRVEQSWQTQSSPQNQKYLLFGPLQNKLAALCSETLKSPGKSIEEVNEVGEESFPCIWSSTWEVPNQERALLIDGTERYLVALEQREHGDEDRRGVQAT